jgi:dienelactone hydrolase
MRKQKIFFTGLMAVSVLFGACNSNNDKKVEETTGEKGSKLKEENITYNLDTVSMNGYVVYDENKEGKRPAVLVVHEWWGMNDYLKMRARELAKLGYIAMAIDMYGNGKTADNPGDAQKAAMPFYQDPQMAKARFDAALNKLKTYSQVDTGNIAGIGYCFGGGMLLNLARLGEDLEGVVSFHGTLLGTPANKDLLKAKILVCHGAADPFVPQTEVDQFKKQMDSIGADYTFKVYEGATHAFTNPASTETGKKFNIPISYNAAADSASWKDMREFFGRIFK